MSISSSNDFNLDEPVQDYLSEEGFARITRDGKSDIYVVQNQEYPGDYRVSLAFALDDFDPSDATKLYGEPLLLNASDVVEFLGHPQDYFVPKAPLFHDCLTVVRKVPKSAGLLPSVRAIEHLRRQGRAPTEKEIDDAVAYHLGDYQRRRALLIA